MDLEKCKKRINNYLSSNDTQPRFVNVNNIDDLKKLKSYYYVGKNIFKGVKNYCRRDDNPSVDSLLNDLNNLTGKVFLTELTTHFMLFGDSEIRKLLSRLRDFTSTSNHLVLICYQCEKYLKDLDVRFQRCIYLVEGEKTKKPKLHFMAPSVVDSFNIDYIDGIENLATKIETSSVDTIYIKTNKKVNSYPRSLYYIKENSSAYEILYNSHKDTQKLIKDYGTEEQWVKALKEVNQHGSWINYFDNIFGRCSNLELYASNWPNFEEFNKWLFFIALKLFGAKNNWCLNTASKDAISVDNLVRCIFRCILTIDFNEKEYWNKYFERKTLLLSFANPKYEVVDYCSMVKSKGKYALYYLTDNTDIEKEVIFETLDKYGTEFSKDEIIGIIKNIYPNLYSYLKLYDFDDELLNSYFQEYKYQKVINKIFPDFENIVEEQARKREFNLILSSRSEKVEEINKKDAQLYFIDALGVEYLSFIMDKCNQKGLIAKVTVCKCELPSITSLNKNFIQVFEENGVDIYPNRNGIKNLDEIKHHGKNKYDYNKTTLPTHLIKELDIIDSILNDIHIKLYNRNYSKVIIVSDHGASRLCVISNKENKWEMESKGIYSGRCCSKSEIDEQPTCATEENGYWVLANYDRFKGSRKANVEVHGGATLEEVTVPIIEITLKPDDIEIQIVTQTIKFSRMKNNAIIKFFSKNKIENVKASISNKLYDTESSDGHNFAVKIPDMKNSGEYSLDIYSNKNLLKSGLKFIAEKEGFKENKLL